MLSIATPAIVGWSKSIPSKPRFRASAGYKSVVNANRLTGASGSVFRLLNGYHIELSLSCEETTASFLRRFKND